LVTCLSARDLAAPLFREGRKAGKPARLRLCSLSQHHHHDAAELPTPRLFTINRIASRVRHYETFCRRRSRPAHHTPFAPPTHTRQIQTRGALAQHHALRAWLYRPWKGSRPSCPLSRSDLSSARTRMTTALVQ
jgi:hypothetical protein